MTGVESSWTTPPRHRYESFREDSDNPVRSVYWHLVLPDSDHGPSGGAELSLIEAIALDVSGDLRAPIGGVGSGACSVFRTPVPEAAIDEDGHFLATKDDVRSAAQVFDWPHIDSISKAAPMKLRPEGKLRAGVAFPIAPHGCSYGGRRGRGCFGNDGGQSPGARSIGAGF